MGYHRHHAIVVTSFHDRYIEVAHAEAERVFEGTAPVTPITAAAVNGFRSFLVAPDGSKEGWADSDRGDAAREQFVAWLRGAGNDGIYVSWVEVNFGGDDGDMIGVRGAYGRIWGRADDEADA